MKLIKSMLIGLLTLVALNISVSEASAAVNIPDDNFRACLNSVLKQNATDSITQAQLEGITTTVECNDMNIRDIEGAQYLTGTQWLHLSRNQISDVSVLSGMTHLSSLYLDDNQVTNVNPLSNLTSLMLLGLDGNGITDISSLSELTNLSYLTLNNNQISNISSLSKMTKLTTLALFGNEITDISSLSGMVDLKIVHLNSNQISDLSVFENLKNVQELILTDNKITDVSSLSDLPVLRSLVLQQNQVSDISGLSNLVTLEYLNLDNNEVNDINDLSKMVNLQLLSLISNQITDLSALENMKDLNFLDVSYNPLDNIDVASKLTNLSSFYAHDAQLTDLSPLKDLSNLSSISARENQVTDISMLGGLTNLRSIELTQNQVSDISILDGLPNLQTIYMSDQKIILPDLVVNQPSYTLPQLAIDEDGELLDYSWVDSHTFSSPGENQLLKAEWHGGGSADYIIHYFSGKIEQQVTYEEIPLELDADDFTIHIDKLEDLTVDVAKLKANVISNYGNVDLTEVVSVDMNEFTLLKSVEKPGVYSLTFNVDNSNTRSSNAVSKTINVTVIDTVENILLDAENFSIHVDDVENLTREETKIKANAVSSYGDENITSHIEVNEAEYEVIKNVTEAGVHDLTFYVEKDGVSVEKTIAVTVEADELPTTGNVNYVWIFPLVIITLYIARKYVVNRKNM